MANLTGLFKEKYADQVETLYTGYSILKDDIKFVEEAKRNGLNYNQPVVTSPEQGFTYAAPAATPSPIPMNAAVSMQMQNATVAPFQMLARCVLDYETAHRSIASRAFEPAAVMQMLNVKEQANTRLEMSLLYGQEGFGRTSAGSAVNGTTTTVTFTAGSFADAAFGSALNAPVQFFSSAGAPVPATAIDQTFIITAVNTATRQVTVTGTTTGSTALVTAAAAGADIFFQSARVSASVFNEMPGLSKIISNTGTLFGIDAAVYDLWKGNIYNAAGALTLAKVNSAVATAVGRGLNSDVTVYVNPLTWGNLITEQNALRHYDTSYSTTTAKNGSQAIEFYSQNGKLTIKVHPFVKPGDAFVVPLKKLRRIGSTDITFQVPGPQGKEKDMFQDLVDSAGYQYKLYTGQTLFCSSPSHLIKITGIVNS